MPSTPKVDRDDQGVVTIRLDGGLLGVREATALRDIARALREDADVRVVLLDSASSDFCAGPDHELQEERLTIDPARALADLSVPVVVALRGAVVSVGLELALAADLRIGAEDAVFAFPEVSEGRLPAWGATQRLPRTVGRPTAFSMLVLGRTLTSVEALASSLVHEVVDDPHRRARECAAALATLGPLAVGYAKEAVLRGSEMPMRDGHALEVDLNTMLQTSEDRHEGLTAFFEKRRPTFRGS